MTADSLNLKPCMACGRHTNNIAVINGLCDSCNAMRAASPRSEIPGNGQLVGDVEEYLHWRKVNPQIKGGENYLKRFRESLASTKRESGSVPEGMEHCHIRFKECDVGHGRLTSDNWVQHGCSTCRISELESAIRDILYNDERGQGSGYAEAMQRAKTLLEGDKSLPPLKLSPQTADR